MIWNAEGLVATAVFHFGIQFAQKEHFFHQVHLGEIFIDHTPMLVSRDIFMDIICWNTLILKLKGNLSYLKWYDRHSHSRICSFWNTRGEPITSKILNCHLTAGSCFVVAKISYISVFFCPATLYRPTCFISVFVIAVCRLLWYCYNFSMILIAQFRFPSNYVTYVMFSIGDAASHHSL